MDWFVSWNSRFYSLDFDLNIEFRARKVTAGLSKNGFLGH